MEQPKLTTVLQFWQGSCKEDSTVLQFWEREKPNRTTVLHFWPCESTGSEHSSAILKKWKLKMSKFDRTFPKWVFTNQQITPEVWKSMCRLHHKGCSTHKRSSKVRQDIYDKLCFKVRKTLQNTAVRKSGLQLCVGKWKSMCRLHHKGSPSQNQGCQSSQSI